MFFRYTCLFLRRYAFNYLIYMAIKKPKNI